MQQPVQTLLRQIARRTTGEARIEKPLLELSVAFALAQSLQLPTARLNPGRLVNYYRNNHRDHCRHVLSQINEEIVLSTRNVEEQVYKFYLFRYRMVFEAHEHDMIWYMAGSAFTKDAELLSKDQHQAINQLANIPDDSGMVNPQRQFMNLVSEINDLLAQFGAGENGDGEDEVTPAEQG